MDKGIFHELRRRQSVLLSETLHTGNCGIDVLINDLIRLIGLQLRDCIACVPLILLVLACSQTPFECRKTTPVTGHLRHRAALYSCDLSYTPTILSQ